MAEEQGLTVKKNDNFSEWYSQVIQKADLADIRFGIQGFIVHKPWSFLIIRKIYEFLEEKVEKQGHLPFLFPTVVKEEDLTKEKEHAGFTPEVFWISEAGSKKLEERFALRPTGEAQIYPTYALWFRSWKDLPFRGYQSRISAFRNEMTTRPFLRGREFLFFEAHDVFYTHEEALAQIEKDLETCENVIRNKLKIPFMYFKRPAWDKFKGADNTFTPDTIMPDGKRNQLASTHDLGQNFAKAYGIQVHGKDEQEQYVWQTCFGPGIWRIMAALIAIHGDDRGLVLPFECAPIQIVIIPITFVKQESVSKKIMATCEKVAEQLKGQGYRVTVDNRNESPGAKYFHWELRGVPLRIEIGPRDLERKSVTLVLRTEGKKRQVLLKEVKKEIEKSAAKNNKDIEKKAEEYFEGRVREADSLAKVKEILKTHRGFVRAPFCSVEKDGEACADMVKAETEGGYVCGTLYPKEESAKGKCIVCNKPARHSVYIAKSY